MHPCCKITGKIVLDLTSVSTYITLKRVFLPMASHVNGVKDVVCRAHVTVVAVVRKLGVLSSLLRLEYLAACFLGWGYRCGCCSGLLLVHSSSDSAIAEVLGFEGRSSEEYFLAQQKLLLGQRAAKS